MNGSTEYMRRIQSILDTLGSGDRSLDELSRRILLQIAGGQSSGRLLTVSDVAINSAYGTPPTLYARLKVLIESGMIKASPNPSDKRSLLLSLTPKAKRQLDAVALKISEVALT